MQQQKQPQLFIIGKINAARRFPTICLYIKYWFKSGDQWNLIHGKESGESFLSQSNESIGDQIVPIEQPFELNYQTQSVRGWPKMMLEVWQVDQEGRHTISGYGLVTVPFQPGTYNIEVGCWRPKISGWESLLNAYPELVHKDSIISSDSRFGFQTQTTGKVLIEFNIVTKDFQYQGIKLSEAN